METLVGGILPIYLITQESLTQTLASISETLRESGNNYEIIHKQAAWYFRRGAFIVKRDEANIYILLQIPLSTFAQNFKIYRVQTFPIPTHESNSEHITQIDDLPKGFAIDEDEKWYYTLDESELKNIATHEHSRVQRVFSWVNENSCIIALYKDRGEQIRQACKFSIIMHSLEPGIKHLHGSTFLLTKIEQHTVTCANVTINERGCKICTIELKSNCSIQTNQQYVSPSFMQSANDSSMTKTEHITNLAILQNFFDNETLRLMRGKLCCKRKHKFLYPH